MEWKLVVPIPAESDGGEVEEHEIPSRARGSRLGLLSNRKPNARVIEEEFGRLAREAGLVDDIKVYEKPGGPGLAAEPELLDAIAAECDVVVVGSAD